MVSFIDTNIFLELQLDDNRADECDEFFSSIRKNKIDCVTSDFVVYSCLIKLGGSKNYLKIMKRFITFLANHPTIEIIRPSKQILNEAFEYMKKYDLDFDDSLVVAVVVENDIDDLISFDKHFDKVKDINRVEPRDLFPT